MSLLSIAWCAALPAAPCGDVHAPPDPDALAATIDRALEAAHHEQGIVAAPPADDATWLRRLSLDVRGTIPARDEVVAFLADPSPARRAERIDAWLRTPEFAANFASLFVNELLETAAAKDRARARMWMAPWIEAELRGAASFATIARGVAAGTSDSSAPGPAGLSVVYRDTLETLSGTLAKSFLGVQIQCAQCHDDPAGRFRQEQFFRFTGFFADLSVEMKSQKSRAGPLLRVMDFPAERRLLEELKRQRGGATRPPAATGTGAAALEPSMALAMAPGEGEGNGAAISVEPVEVPTIDELIATLSDPQQGRAWCAEHLKEGPLVDALRPTLSSEAAAALQRCVDVAPFREAGHLDGAPWSPIEGRSRRDALADWMVAPSNPWFARNLANRLCAHFLGHGLIEPIDDLSSADDAVAPELLDELARAFHAAGTDVRALAAALLRTRAYARGPSIAASRKLRRRDERWFAAHPLRPFTAEQAANALLQLRPESAPPEAPDDRRARIQQRDRVVDDLRRTFGQLGGAGRGGAEATIPQALLLMNGPFGRLSESLRASPAALAFLDPALPLAERLAGLWLQTLGRRPSATEVEEIGRLLADGGELQEQLALLHWALVNSAEFHTNR